MKERFIMYKMPDTMKTTLQVILLIGLVTGGSCTSRQTEKTDDLGVALNFADKAPAFEETVKFASPEVAGDEQVYDGNNAGTEISGDKSTVKKKKIIKDGNISVKTNNIEESKKNIDGLLQKLSAYYENEDMQNNDRSVSYDLKIRVPAYNFEKLIAGIENGKDEVKSKSIQARDVTEEYVDTETRLANKREYLKRYKELLSRASTVKDIIAIEENIRTLQEEIESKEGRLRYLSDQVAYSTLYLNIYKEKEFVYKPQPQDKFSERVKKSLSNGWVLVVDFVLFTITIWPITLLILVLFYFFRRRRSRKRKSKQTTN